MASSNNTHHLNGQNSADIKNALSAESALLKIKCLRVAVDAQRPGIIPFIMSPMLGISNFW